MLVCCWLLKSIFCVNVSFRQLIWLLYLMHLAEIRLVFLLDSQGVIKLFRLSCQRWKVIAAALCFWADLNHQIYGDFTRAELHTIDDDWNSDHDCESLSRCRIYCWGVYLNSQISIAVNLLLDKRNWPSWGDWVRSSSPTERKAISCIVKATWILDLTLQFYIQDKTRMISWV